MMELKERQHKQVRKLQPKLIEVVRSHVYNQSLVAVIKPDADKIEAILCMEILFDTRLELDELKY